MKLTQALIIASTAFATTVLAANHEMIRVYAKPNFSSNTVAKVKPGSPLVTIFRKGHWYKVGDRRNGKVGWVNQKQFHQTLESYYAPDINSTVIQTYTGKDGKIHTVAYRNGKKLSKKETHRVVKEMRAREKRDVAAMNHFDHDMQRMMNDEWHEEQTMMHDFPMEPDPVIR